MIDIESELFTKIATVLRAAYDGIYVAPEYVPKPPRFPAVFIVEMDNSVLRSGADSQNIENFAEIVYEVNIFSDLHTGKKAQAKAIAALIDSQFAEMGFTRMMLNPVPNLNDATIYRVVGRYRAVVSKDQVIYRS
jgi:hypothetical protein